MKNHDLSSHNLNFNNNTKYRKDNMYKMRFLLHYKQEISINIFLITSHVCHYNNKRTQNLDKSALSLFNDQESYSECWCA